MQGVLQDVLRRVTGEAIVVEFAGRTDAGVHAEGQVISFETGFRHGVQPLQRAINSLAPSDVAAASVEEVPLDFHARRSARQRWYRYTVDNGRRPRPLLDRHSWFYPHRVDVARMNAAGAVLLGAHDFLAFGDVPGGRESSVRRLDEVHAERQGDLITIDLRASAFLKHMARSMVGLLLRAGGGAVSPAEAGRILRDRDRHAAGPVAPARGLCLMGVTYESPLPLGEGKGEGK